MEYQKVSARSMLTVIEQHQVKLDQKGNWTVTDELIAEAQALDDAAGGSPDRNFHFVGSHRTVWGDTQFKLSKTNRQKCTKLRPNWKLHVGRPSNKSARSAINMWNAKLSKAAGRSRIGSMPVWVSRNRDGSGRLCEQPKIGMQRDS
jgi:hypothetical protein